MVADHEHDDAVVDAGRRFARPGQRRAARDAREHALGGEHPGGLDGFPWADDHLAVQQVRPAPLLEDGRHVPVVEAAQALHLLARRRLDSPHLHRRRLLLEIAAHAQQGAAGAQPGNEVGDIGHIGQDLGTSGAVVRVGIGLVPVLVEHGPVGVRLGKLVGELHGTVGPLLRRAGDDLGAEDLEHLAPLVGDVARKHDLHPIAAALAEHGQRNAGVARRGFEDHRAGAKPAVGLGAVKHRQRHAVLHRAGRVLAFQLGVEPHRRVGAQAADIKRGRAADQLVHGAIDGHIGALGLSGQPPATAGRIDSSSPSDSVVSILSR